MRTRLGAFASGFEASFHGVLDVLDDLVDEPATAEYLSAASDLEALLRRCRALADRVAAEDAYVLIFGPLKSGKSTLMNALSGAYVSEVGSLPGYPCLVQVSDAEEPSFTVLHYNGQEERFADLAAMRIHAQRSHVALAERIREAEAAGRAFDAANACPEAIRKIEIRMPTAALRASSATLVDTPGLYTRMKFDYDRLTHEYRDVASCAVFVVKSDNLFLEQVFAEFGELLELFSRVFLIVNVDTKKLDVAPDGGLVRSLEQTDPARVIEAFENLSMPAEMRAAADEGRLRIYPIDLLGAAARRLRSRSAETGEVPEAAAAGPAAAEPEATTMQSSFEAFLEDLTAYLNGSEHLTDFMQDSLRRLEGVLDQLDAYGERPEVRAISSKLEEAEGARARIEARHAAVERLSERDWRASFEGLRERLTTRTRELADRVAESNRSTIGDAIDGWLDSNASVRSLNEQDLVPLFSQACKSLYVGVARTLRQETERPSGGSAESGSFVTDLSAAGMKFDVLARGIVDRVEGGEQVPSVPTPLVTSEIPVKKGFFGWLFFRSRAAARGKLFGPEENPDVSVPRAKKAKRLPEHASVDMKEVVAGRLHEFLSSRVMNLRAGLLDRYVELFAGQVEKRLAEAREVVVREEEQARKECASLRGLLDRLNALDEATSTARTGVPRLMERFVSREEAERVLEPVAPPEAAEEPEPQPEPVVETGDEEPFEIEPVRARELHEPADARPADPAG